MKKQYVILGIVLACLIIGGVSAGFITNYFERVANVGATNPISVIGDLTQEINGLSGDVLIGIPITIINIADWDIDVQVNSSEEDGIEIGYIGGYTGTSPTVTILANSNVTFTPMYFLLQNLESGNYSITTSVNPITI